MSFLLASAARWLAAFLLSAAPLLAPAQLLQTVRFEPGTSLARVESQFQPAPGGGWWFGGAIRYGTDSAHFRLARLGADVRVQRERQARVPSVNGSYTLRLAPTALFVGGFVANGASRGAFVYRLDTTLATQWGGRFTNVTSLRALVPQSADTLVTYMTRSLMSGGNIRLVRAWTPDDTRWRAKELDFPGPGVPPIQSILPVGRRGVHYLGGAESLVKLDTTKVYWAKVVAVAGTGALDIQQVAVAANGDLLALLTAQIVAPTNQPVEAIVARFDTAGNVLSSRRITALGRHIRLWSMVELPGSDLVLAGDWLQGSTLQPLMIRLSAAGNVVWSRRWNLSGRGTRATLVRRAGGRYALSLIDGSVVELDANFAACQFLDEPAGAVTAAPELLTVSSQTVSYLPFAPTFVPEPLLDRTETFTRSLVCSSVVGVAEDAAAETSFTAWPQPLPRGAALHLALPTGWRAADTQLTLTSGLGQVVWRGPWAETLKLPAGLPAGVWTLVATAERGQVMRRRLVTE